MNHLVFGLSLMLIPVPPDVDPVDLDRFPPGVVVSAQLDDVIIPHRGWVTRQFGKAPYRSEAEDHWRLRQDDMQWRWDCWDDLRLAQKYRGGAYLRDRLWELCCDSGWPYRAPNFLKAYYWKQVFNAGRDGDLFVRDVLRRLRGKIGAEAYCRGQMPCPVPVWLFDFYDGY